MTPFDDGSSPFTRTCSEEIIRLLGILGRATLAFVEKVMATPGFEDKIMVSDINLAPKQSALQNAESYLRL